MHPSAESDLFEQLGNAATARRGVHAVERPVIIHQAVGAVVFGKTVILRQITDPVADLGGAGGFAEQAGFAVAMLDNAEQDLD